MITNFHTPNVDIINETVAFAGHDFHRAYEEGKEVQ
jgi:S-adenosylmethionine:tRNA-ribosyltransferase-isomerase (queuine synthetase)